MTKPKEKKITGPTSSLLWGIILLFILAACTSSGSEPAPTGANDSITAGEVQEQEEARPTTQPEPAQTNSNEETAETETEISPETAETSGGEPIVTEDGLVIFTVDDRGERLRSLTRTWNTNWNLHTIDYSEILSGGPPRDGIPSIDDPKFITPEEAATWLADNEPVIAFEWNGDARAYPLQILTWHEIVNDIVGDLPVLITFCPLCNSAIVFDRTINGETFEFGTSGLLRNSDLVMYDRTTESLWQQLTGDAIVGDMVGTRLKFLPSSLISFADFREAHPNGKVLSRDTGYNRRYGENPYVGYDQIGQNPFLFTGPIDGRLPAMERVVTVSLNDTDVAYPLSVLSELGVINDTINDTAVVVFHKPGTASALGAQIIAQAEDVGATGVFERTVDDQTLTFRRDGDNFVDEETGTTWNILGQAITGPLASTQLTPVVHGDHFWFSWAAFKPDTIIYTP